MSADAQISPELQATLDFMTTRPGDDSLRYYAFTLTADAGGRGVVGTQTHWLGWQDDDPRIEIRQASLVTAGCADGWAAIGHPCYFVLDHMQVLAFLLAGGAALIERTVAEEGLAHYLGPHPAHHYGQVGFADPRLLDERALNRAPTPRLRMAVLNRDGRRCRVCGRRPDDDVDVVLNVHHIRPWAEFGVTDRSNLLTLCHTCHSGLDPHFDPSLFNYLRSQDGADSTTRFTNRVARYRREIVSRWS